MNFSENQRDLRETTAYFAQHQLINSRLPIGKLTKMENPWIKLDSDQFSFEEIKKGKYASSFNGYKRIVLDFCRDWLNGSEKFTLHTSGSTGNPKEIEFTRKQLEASARLTASVLGLQKGFTSLVCLDTRYTAGTMMLVRSLVSGMNMIIVEPASNPLEKIEAHSSIHFTAMVPLQIETILKSPQKENLSEIKIVLIGGAELSHKTAKALAPMKASFYATYGMTETLSHIAVQKLNGTDAQDFFQVLPHISISNDERGCLNILAPHISEDLVVTNDLVELVGPSQFRWLGRVDNIINTGGVKVMPEKIEAVIGELLVELKVSRHFFVAARPDPILGESVNLFFEGDALPVRIEELIWKKCSVSLDRFERPKSIYYVKKFIETDTGKINKGRTMACTQT